VTSPLRDVTVYVATKNAGKLRELQQILAAYGVTALAYAGYADVAEGEASYAENAALKARALRAALDAAGIAAPALGDDSGLEVAALGGRPGVLSARYGGDAATWAERRALLLAETAAAVSAGNDGGAARTARFVCALHWAEAGGDETAVLAELRGELALEERGDGGFSYDAIFESEEGRTFAELSEEEKNAVSHRALAVKALVEALPGRIPPPSPGTIRATGM
jgi:XTP/dITP diphosphohydrolase